MLKPSELLDKLAQLIPPSRRHRHYYHGVLAPNSPLRSRIAAQANIELIPVNIAQEKESRFREENIPFLLNEKHSKEMEQAPASSPAQNNQAPVVIAESRPKEKKQPGQASLFRWAVLLARIFEVLPLCCPKCNHPMRIISFIEDPHTIRKILTHINEPVQPPPIAPARGPPEPVFNYDQTCEFA
jgi:uncharacterized protein YbaR (Trm112 family)